jgi:hypothetical protein
MCSAIFYLMLIAFEIFRYDDNGNCHGKVEVIPPTPTRLQWDFNDEQMLKTIDMAHLDAQKVLNVRPATGFTAKRN